MNKGGYRLELNRNGNRIDVYQGSEHFWLKYKRADDGVNLNKEN